MWGAENPDLTSPDAIVVPPAGRRIYADLVRRAVADGHIPQVTVEACQAEIERLEYLIARDRTAPSHLLGPDDFRNTLGAMIDALTHARDAFAVPAPKTTAPEPIGLAAGDA